MAGDVTITDDASRLLMRLAIKFSDHLTETACEMAEESVTPDDVMDALRVIMESDYRCWTQDS